MDFNKFLRGDKRESEEGDDEKINMYMIRIMRFQYALEVRKKQRRCWKGGEQGSKSVLW